MSETGLNLCDVEHLYMGTIPLYKVYAGDQFIWPCYDCSIEDPVMTEAPYDDAVVYLPKVCAAVPSQSDWAPPQIRDGKAVFPWPEEVLVPGPGYSGVWSIGGAGATWGFSAPDSPTKYGQVIIEEESPQVYLNIGDGDTGSIQFWIKISEIGLDVNGIIIQVDSLEVQLNGYEFFPAAIKARALRSDPFFPIECVATESLPLDDETQVTVVYEYIESVIERLQIYYDAVLVGEFSV